MLNSFWGGLVVGVVGVWAYHRYVKPMPTKSTG